MSDIFVSYRRVPRWFTVPFVAFVLTRLLVVGALYLPRAAGIVLFESPTFNFAPMSDVPAPLQPWARWDSGWYVRIADQGYDYVRGSILPEDNDVAFFPLYPVLIHSVTWGVGNSLLAGLIISNTCFLLALMLLYRFTEVTFNAVVAARTVLYLALFPTAFFFSAVYTESLFLLLSLITAWYSFHHRWLLAAFSAALASAVRAQGVLLMLLVGLEWIRANGGTAALMTAFRQSFTRTLRLHIGSLVSIALIPSGLLLYMLYLQVTFGNAFAFNDALHVWGRQTVGPWNAIANALAATFSPQPEKAILPYYRLLEITAFFAGMILCYWVYRRMGLSYALYCLTSIWVTASGRIEGQLRYGIMLFPLFMVMAAYARSRFNLVYCALCLVLLPLFAFFFTNWIFVG